jgi:hypothetical protein
MFDSLQGPSPPHFIPPGDKDLAFHHRAFPAPDTQGSAAGSSSTEQPGLDDENRSTTILATEIFDEDTSHQVQGVPSPSHSTNQDNAFLGTNVNPEVKSSIEDPDSNLADQYILRADPVTVEGQHPEEFLQEVQKREVLEFRTYRNFVHISSRNHPVTTTPRKHKASSAGTTRKEADFAEKITDEMNSKFAEITVKDFLQLFSRGPNLTKKQLKTIGDFSDLDTTDEAKMYPTLVRKHLGL